MVFADNFDCMMNNYMNVYITQINLMRLCFSVSNRDGLGALSYRMLDCPDQVVIAQVDDKGILFSGSLTGISSLLITSQETFGVNQTLILAVKVS